MAASDGPQGPQGPPSPLIAAELDSMDPLSISLAIAGPLGQIFQLLRVIVELKNVERKKTEVLRHAEGLQLCVERLEALELHQPASPGRQRGLEQTHVHAIATRSRELLTSLLDKLDSSTDKPKNWMKKTGWIIQQRELAQKFNEDIKKTNALLTLYIYPLHLQSLNSILRMEPKVSALLRQSQIIYDQVATKTGSAPECPAVDDAAAPGSSPTSHGSAEPSDSRHWLRGPRLNFEFHRHRGQARGRQYVIVVRANVGSHLVVAQLSGPLVFTIFPRLTQMSLRNIVPEDAPIFHACRTDDAYKAMDLLRKGKASFSDVTPTNDTLLAVAIQSSSLEVVELLLKQGANANLSCGKYETSPLQLAVLFRQLDHVRTLLRYNADMEYVSASGRSLLHHLFFPVSESDPSNAEFFRVLETRDLLFDDTQDDSGWTALHRCAAYGTSGDVNWILKHGGTKCLDYVTVGRSLTSLQVAALFNNVDTLDAITSAHAHAASATGESSREAISRVVNFKDSNGWTALHVAVDSGARDTTRWLLSHRADPHLKTHRTATWFPEGHKGESFSVIDLVRIQGEKFFQAFAEDLLDVRSGVLLSDEGDLFWDTEESASSASDSCSEDCQSNCGLGQ